MTEKLREPKIQIILYNWLHFTLHHEYIMPNVKYIYGWECDIISLTQSGFVNEFEIKISKADFKADFNKEVKHKRMSQRINFRPSKFWYVIHGFDLDTSEVPEYAGLIKIMPDNYGFGAKCAVIKKAPKIYNKPLPNHHVESLKKISYKRMWVALETLHDRSAEIIKK